MKRGNARNFWRKREKGRKGAIKTRRRGFLKPTVLTKRNYNYRRKGKKGSLEISTSNC